MSGSSTQLILNGSSLHAADGSAQAMIAMRRITNLHGSIYAPRTIAVNSARSHARPSRFVTFPAVAASLSPSFPRCSLATNGRNVRVLSADCWVTILAGGAGHRFWPLSTPARPKQLLPLAGPRPLVVETIERVRGIVPPERLRILAGEDLVAPIRAATGLGRECFLVETRAAGTGPVLARAAWEIARDDPGAVMISLHSDHLIEPARSFRDVLRAAVEIARRDRPSAHGCRPSRPARDRLRLHSSRRGAGRPGRTSRLPGRGLRGETRRRRGRPLRRGGLPLEHRNLRLGGPRLPARSGAARARDLPRAAVPGTRGHRGLLRGGRGDQRGRSGAGAKPEGSPASTRTFAGTTSEAGNRWPATGPPTPGATFARARFTCARRPATSRWATPAPWCCWAWTVSWSCGPGTSRWSCRAPSPPGSRSTCGDLPPHLLTGPTTAPGSGSPSA